MIDEHEQDPAEAVDAGDAPEGAVSADDLLNDPGEPDKGVQWDAPERTQQATASAEAAAAEDSGGG